MHRLGGRAKARETITCQLSVPVPCFGRVRDQIRVAVEEVQADV